MKKTTKTKTTTPEVSALNQAPVSTPRQLQMIQQEYTQLCAKAGELNFRIHQATRDLTETNVRLTELNQEALKVQAMETLKAQETLKKTPKQAEEQKSATA